MDQPSNPLPASQIDRTIAKLAHTLDAVYGNAWTIIWRNFLAGFMRVVGMIFAYMLILAIVFTIITKSGALGYVQGLWKNITQSLISDVQKNLEKSLPKEPFNLNQLNVPVPLTPLEPTIPLPNQL